VGDPDGGVDPQGIVNFTAHAFPGTTSLILAAFGDPIGAGVGEVIATLLGVLVICDTTTTAATIARNNVPAIIKIFLFIMVLLQSK
jgi:hypothetical protein